MCQFIKLPVELIGKVSERALILYALMLDRLELSKQHKDFQDVDGRPFIYYTRAEVERVFGIKHCTATALFAELETASLIVRKFQGQGKPIKIFFQTSEKSVVKTSEKSVVKTSEKSVANQTNHNQTNRFSSSDNEICENQITFDDFFLEMTVHDTIGKIIAEIVTENQQEFSEITAEIADFVAEKVIKAAENKKLANIRGYARAALRHGKTDYDAACDASGTSNGYGATYDIAAYENYSAADSPEWND